MNTKREDMRRNLSDFASRPRLLLAYADPAYASDCGRYFRRLGWEVQMVASGVEARQLVSEFEPEVVALDAELADESGWLTSAKLSTENPDLRIVLVTDDANPNDRVAMVGAQAAVRRADGAEALAYAVLGTPFLAHAI